ncbi:hypothetical protein CAPTEDRAFT_201836 [Capitella teleta]|uniref:Uncharacterized protein n=1 Tax=Capitella teleta TaxID=283909 RepID=R7U9J2_CAPTE|nr:hypothetical protein CAPTEDRAFT_201836 [Capitella teleta]|eukprot:ELU03015.1 hypothetical protein CAPTEDRAFT_201836 [Capitella teleta]
MPSSSGTPLAPAATTSPVNLHSTPTLNSETFALFSIEALRDKSVIAALIEANKSNANEVADMVILKLGTRVKYLEEELKSTQKGLKEAREMVNELEGNADDQEHYSRRTSIRINGLLKNNDENVSDLVNDLFKTMNINPSLDKKILDNLKNYNSLCYVMGDFNLDLLNSDAHREIKATTKALDNFCH